jgi:ketosteroid isomerase-like protein
VSDADEVRAIEEHWPVALAQRDRAGLLDHVTDGFVCIEPDGTVLDRDAYLDQRVIENEVIVDAQNAAVHLEVIGDAATVVNRGRFVVEGVDGALAEVTVLGSGVYLRVDGAWRAALMHLTTRRTELPSGASAPPSP